MNLQSLIDEQNLIKETLAQYEETMTQYIAAIGKLAELVHQKDKFHNQTRTPSSMVALINARSAVTDDPIAYEAFALAQKGELPTEAEANAAERRERGESKLPDYYSSSEAGYRSGYSQGYQAALQDSRNFTFDQMYKHGGTILDWRFRKIEGHLPPEIKP